MALTVLIYDEFPGSGAVQVTVAEVDENRRICCNTESRKSFRRVDHESCTLKTKP